MLGDATQASGSKSSSYEVAASIAPVPPRMLVLALTADFTPTTASHVEECPDIGPACASVPRPRAYNHNLQTFSYGSTLDALYGLAPFIALSLSVPFRFATVRVRYTDLAGSDYVPVPPDVHHRNETLSGLGDPLLALVFGRAIGRVGFSLQLGALLPFGRTLDVDPFEAGREGIPHEHIQFGAGIVRPIVGSALGYDFGAIGVDGYFQGTLAFASNAIGYRPGQRIAAGLRVTSALGLHAVRFGLGVELTHETAETWHDVAPSEGNLGRTDLLAVASARWSPFRGWGLFSALKVPLFVDAVGAQLSYPLVAQLGVAAGFSL